MSELKGFNYYVGVDKGRGRDQSVTVTVCRNNDKTIISDPRRMGFASSFCPYRYTGSICYPGR